MDQAKIHRAKLILEDMILGVNEALEGKIN